MSLRWSPDGNHVAVASDDSYITVYNLSSTPSSTVGFDSSSSSNLETWSKKHVLRGHSLDCVDLAWSPTASHLVTCSLDSKAPICVWDLSSSSSLVLQPYKILGNDAHPGGCKGVCFDPCGLYFSTSGDSPNLSIWSTRTWSLERTISECFSDKTDLTMFRRISWSPDGTGLGVSNCNIGGRMCASILGRDHLRTLANLVGHKTGEREGLRGGRKKTDYKHNTTFKGVDVSYCEGISM